MIVDVYYNLHRKCLSIRYKGKIIRYTQEIVLENCQFLVSLKGRERVIQSKRKNVHAVVRGSLSNSLVPKDMQKNQIQSL